MTTGEYKTAKFCAESCAKSYGVPWVYYVDEGVWLDTDLETYERRGAPGSAAMVVYRYLQEEGDDAGPS